MSPIFLSFIFLWASRDCYGVSIGAGANRDLENATSVTTVTSENIPVSTNDSEIDFETLSHYGVDRELAQEFRLNLLKAIEALKEQDANMGLRQNEFGGAEGGFGPGGGDAEEEEDDEEMVVTTPGPGAFGVLSGIFGIFTGLGSLNPSRIVQSTVNFFPPGRRMHAQMVVDSLIGYAPGGNSTTNLKTRRPPTTPPTPLQMSNATMEESSNATMIETMNATSSTMLNDTSMTTVIAKDSESNSAAAPITTTTEWFINLSGLLNMTSTAVPPTDEDDEVDVENKLKNSTNRPSGIGNGGYKLIRPKPEIMMTVAMNETLNGTLNSNMTVMEDMSTSGSSPSSTTIS